jgi:hypothetical protein
LKKQNKYYTDKLKVNDCVEVKTLDTALVVDNIIEKKEDNVRTITVRINTVEDDAFIATIGGYSKRIYFDLNNDDLEYLRNNKLVFVGKMLTIFYLGDIEKAFDVTILPVNSLHGI